MGRIQFNFIKEFELKTFWELYSEKYESVHPKSYFTFSSLKFLIFGMEYRLRDVSKITKSF